MSIIMPSADSGDLSDLADQARRVADALDRLSHDRPSASDLADAPMLRDCHLAARLAPAFHGVVTGHPLIGSGRRTLTSEVFAYDPDAYGPGVGWARTWSRLYRITAPGAFGRGRGQ
jgi:hypothetical protein